MRGWRALPGDVNNIKDACGGFTIMKVSIKPPAKPQLKVARPGFMLVGMMRSGSNFLERKLNMLPSIRCHGELFNPKFVGFAADFGESYVGYWRNDTSTRNRDSLGFMNEVLEACDRQQCGFRMFLDHDPAVMAETLYNPAIKKIVLTRNLLDSYISLQIARETDVWLTTDPARQDHIEKVHVDPDELVNFALRQSMFYNDVLTILHRTGQRYFHIDYSEIKELDQLNGIAEFLGVPDRFATIDEPIKRQNPAAQKDKITNHAQLVEALRERSMARWFI